MPHHARRGDDLSNRTVYTMFSYTPYILLPLFSAAVTASLAIALFRQRRRPAARYVFRLMIILAVWSCSYALNTASTTLPLKVFFYKTAATFAPFLGVFTLALALDLLGYGSMLTRGRLALLAAFLSPLLARLLLISEYRSSLSPTIILRATTKASRPMTGTSALLRAIPLAQSTSPSA